MYVQSDTLLLGDAFDNFQNTCLEIYELDSARFLTEPRLAWQAGLKKTKVKQDLLIDTDTLKKIKKGIRGRIYYAFYQYGKGNDKYIKNWWK